MSGQAASRRKIKTDDLILDAAERLYGRHGPDGVSLRQIALAAGSSSNFSVQYHFGNRDSLIQAILERRLPSLEARRGRALADAQRSDALADPKTLLGILLTPLAEELDGEGRRSYAAFLASINQQAMVGDRYRLVAAAPLTEHVRNLLQAAVPQVPSGMFQSRLAVARTLYVSVIAHWDAEQLAGNVSPFPADDALLSEALELAFACLLAPVSEAVRRGSTAPQDMN